MVFRCPALVSLRGEDDIPNVEAVPTIRAVRVEREPQRGTSGSSILGEVDLNGLLRLL